MSCLLPGVAASYKLAATGPANATGVTLRRANAVPAGRAGRFLPRGALFPRGGGPGMLAWRRQLISGGTRDAPNRILSVSGGPGVRPAGAGQAARAQGHTARPGLRPGRG